MKFCKFVLRLKSLLVPVGLELIDVTQLKFSAAVGIKLPYPLDHPYSYLSMMAEISTKPFFPGEQMVPLANQNITVNGGYGLLQINESRLPLLWKVKISRVVFLGWYCSEQEIMVMLSGTGIITDIDFMEIARSIGCNFE